MTTELQTTAPLLPLAITGALGTAAIATIALLISAATFRWSTFLIVAVIAGWAAFVDARTSRLPNPILALLAGATTSITLAAAVATSSPAPLINAIIGAGILGGIYLGMGLLGWVGFGDVKLAGILGAYLGTIAIATAPAAASLAILLAGAQQLAARARSRANHPRQLPHGPALAGAALIVSVSWLVV